MSSSNTEVSKVVSTEAKGNNEVVECKAMSGSKAEDSEVEGSKAGVNQDVGNNNDSALVPKCSVHPSCDTVAYTTGHIPSVCVQGVALETSAGTPNFLKKPH